MQKKLYHMLSSIVFVFVLVFLIDQVTDILSSKESIEKYHDMKGENFDVLFFGNSHALLGVYPMELWNDFGIISYNCAGSANMLPTSYWMLKNVLNEQNPKLVVIDVFMVGGDEKRREGRNGVYQQHISFDWQPLTKEKLGMMNFLMDSVDERIEFIAPITLYHDRWKELVKNDFDCSYNAGKGAQFLFTRAAPEKIESALEHEMIMEDSLGKEYLCKMIEECQKKGIEVLLIHIPYPDYAWHQQWGNGVRLIAQQYHVNYVNMFYEDTGVDFFTDVGDANSHLNASGGRKVTKFLGKYIQDHYAIPDRRGEARYDGWYDDYLQYTSVKWETLRNIKADMLSYLSLLYDENLDVCLFFNGESEMIYWGTPPKLVENIATLQRFQKASDERIDYLMVSDRGWGNVTEYLDTENVRQQNTSFGTIQYTKRDENGIRGLYINGGETNYLLNNNGTLAEIAVVAFDKKTGELVDSVRFNRNVSVAAQ